MQEMTKTKVFVMFDGCCGTWNVMKDRWNCLFFGTADDVDDWFEENKERYQEVDELEMPNPNSDSLNKVA